jgi:serine/threonine protein kinase
MVIVEQLGEGAFGRVFQAKCYSNQHQCVCPLSAGIHVCRQLSYGQTVAVKQLKVISIERLIELEQEVYQQARLGQKSDCHDILLFLLQIHLLAHPGLTRAPARTLLRLDHVNIVRFYGVSIVDCRFSLIFEYMNGGDLVVSGSECTHPPTFLPSLSIIQYDHELFLLNSVPHE